MSISFENSALKFMKDLEAKNGEDLIYSLALEGGNVFVMITAFPSMTKKRWSTGNQRLMFLIDTAEYDIEQDLLVEDLTKRIQEHMVFVDDPDVDIFGNKISSGNKVGL
jgi:hypothetical protein